MYLIESLGYGTYLVRYVSPVHFLDPGVAWAPFFLWDYTGTLANGYRCVRHARAGCRHRRDCYSPVLAASDLSGMRPSDACQGWGDAGPRRALVGVSTHTHGSACREVDFEVSRWGNASEPTSSQFTLRPLQSGVPRAIVRYSTDLQQLPLWQGSGKGACAARGECE